MRLIEVQVQKFRNIIDSTPVAIEPDVTCLVGKNESGKSAFLQALYLLNPARSNVALSAQDQYPAWLNKQDRQAGVDLEAFSPIRVTFEFDEADRAALGEKFGPNTVTSETLTITRSYDGKKVFTFETDEAASVGHIVSNAAANASLTSEALRVKTIEALDELAQRLQSQAEPKEDGSVDQASADAAAALLASRKAALGDQELRKAVVGILSRRLPKFFYFADYSRLPSIVKIRELLAADPATLDDDDHVALALLRLAGTDDDYLLDPDYEVRRREIEAVGNLLTQQVLDYWTQNPYLRVMLDISQTTEHDQHGHPFAVLDELRVRMWDDRHLLSLPFSERSTGFRWFFSFLAAFSEFESSPERVIVLLDEPALGLHARAQKDYLRFINERLSPKQQVIYATHSPFMVEPDHLDRVRLVEDTGREEGSRVTSDVLSTDPDTLFPLQGALGYDIAQHLFVAPHNLVVEGTSDFTYLTVLSDFLKDQGRVGLDERWSIIPAGGADLIPTFVALLGVHLDLTVLVDAKKGGHQRLSNLAAQGYLVATRLVTVGDAIARKDADIEDAFAVDDYLAIYNQAFGTALTPQEVKGADRIVKRISRHVGTEFTDHGRPADVLLRRRDEILPKLSTATLDRFEKLFEIVNATMPTS